MALEPRTISGSTTAAAAHSSAPNNSPIVSVGPTTWVTALSSEASQTIRDGVPLGDPSHRLAPAGPPPSSGSESASHQYPSAPRPARRDHREACPARAGYAPARPTSPSTGASPAVSQPMPGRGPANSSGAVAASASSATPGRALATCQTATAMTQPAHTARGSGRRSGPRVPPSASTVDVGASDAGRARVSCRWPRAPATSIRWCSRVWCSAVVGAWGAAGERGRSKPLGSRGRRPARRPSRPRLRVGLRARASSRAACRSSRPPRPAGSAASAVSRASVSARGRSGRRAASGGRGRPMRRAVAAGVGPRTGLIPASPSYKTRASE